MAPRVNAVHPLVQLIVTVAALVVIGAAIYISVAIGQVRDDMGRITARVDRATSGLTAIAGVAEGLKRLVSSASGKVSSLQMERELGLASDQLSQMNQKLDTISQQLATANRELAAIHEAGGGRGRGPGAGGQ